MEALIKGERKAARNFVKNSVAIILNWNLEKVKMKMLSKGFDHEQLEKMEIEYKRFLTLVVKYSNRLPISSVVDEMWHTHILFTRDYENMCKELGCFIHHEPVTTEERKQALLPEYEETLSLYRENWGEPNIDFWPPQDCVCDPEGEGNDDTGGMW